MDAVADELHRRVDLVRDAGGHSANRLQLLGMTQLDFELLASVTSDEMPTAPHRLALRAEVETAGASHHRTVPSGQIVRFSTLKSVPDFMALPTVSRAAARSSG